MVQGIETYNDVDLFVWKRGLAFSGSSHLIEDPSNGS